MKPEPGRPPDPPAVINQAHSLTRSPRVSLIIPTRNEEKYISQTIESLLQQDYPSSSLEIMFVDGMSTDRTREIIRGYIRRYPFIRLIENPLIFTNHAFNLGIQHSRSDIIVIMGAHTRYSVNYVSTLAQYLSTEGEHCAGSVAETIPGEHTFTAKSIAHAISCRFGVGNSHMRIGVEKPVYADTASCSGYRREVFEKVGLFNEHLTYSQDMEFHIRLKKAGYKVLLLPDITSFYHARPDLKSFTRHNLRNGLWVILPFRHTDIIPISFRHLVPLAFVSSLIGSLCLSALSPVFLWLVGGIVSLYSAAALYYSGKIALREKDLRFLLIMPVIFFILHAVYGLGSLWGLVRVSLSGNFWRNLLRNAVRRAPPRSSP